MGWNGKNWQHEKLIGQKINRLLVESVDLSQSPRIYYICRCECGNKSRCRKEALTTKKVVSCGCFQKEMARIGKKRLPKGERARRNQYSKYIQGAKSRNLEFNLSYKEFVDLTQLNCFYCNSKPLKRWNVHGGDFCTGNGIDRIDSAKGYEINNVVPCCYECNRAKSNMSLDSFKKLISAIFHNLKLT